MQTWEWNHVDSQLPQISVQLTGESQARGDTGHGGGHQMIQVTVGGRGQLQRTEADIVQSLVVNAEGFVCVLNQLVDGKGGVVGFNNCVGDLKI